MLRGYGEFARSLLGPTRRAELAQRVRHLTQTRADTIDTGAAEMRRIERDLHDGAQARLVAMEMTLDAAGQLLDTSPAAARALLAEARDSSVQGPGPAAEPDPGIRPPVLADRGVADAVRALVLDSPLQVEVTSELPARPPAPVESAAYFAVSELLANVSKHARADRVWIDIRYHGRRTAPVCAAAGCCGSASPMMAAAVPIQPGAPGCAASSPAWRSSTVSSP